MYRASASDKLLSIAFKLPIWLGELPFGRYVRSYAFQQVDHKGWLSAPSDDVDFSDDASQNTQCPKTKGSGNDDGRAGMQVLTAGSSRIHDDGTYVHKSISLGRIDKDDIPGSMDHQLYFAQLVNYGGADRGGERDDMILIQSRGPWASFRVNLGGGEFSDWVHNVNVDHDCYNSGTLNYLANGLTCPLSIHIGLLLVNLLTPR